MRVGIFNIVALAAVLPVFKSESSKSATRTEIPVEHRIKLARPSDFACHFDFSPVDLCNDNHTSAYERAIDSKTTNFSDHHRIVIVEERPKYDQVSIVAIDLNDHSIFPVPVDYFSPARGRSTDEAPNQSIRFKPGDSSLCLTGDLVAYRSILSGEACFTFDGAQFVGFDTPYTEAGKWQGKRDD